MSNITGVYLITGFLGSGKTTLLNRIIQRFPQNQKLTLLVNEFGEVGVDGTLVEGDDIDMMEISKGSIFCVCVKTDFIKGLYELSTTVQPDVLLIESTGVTNPSDLKKDLMLPIFSNRFQFSEQFCIVDAAHFAPSGHNVQSTKYIVVQDRATLDKIVALTAAYFAKTSQQLHNPVIRLGLRLVSRAQLEGALRMLPEIDLLLEAVKQGADPVLRGAPCFIALYARANTVLPSVNAQLALHNATLAAQALGLGSFYTGFVLAACDRDPSIPSLLAVPKGHRVYAGMALGHPKFPFTNWIQRRPPSVTWR